MTPPEITVRISVIAGTALALLLLATPPAGHAWEDGSERQARESAKDTVELPAARDLIERHIEAVGGREAVLAQVESTMTGRLEFPAAGMSGPLTIASRPPSDRVMIVELPGMGEIRTGYSPELAWSVDPFMGPRILTGPERDAMTEQAEPRAMLRDPEFFSTIETVGETELDNGATCYRVRLEWQSGRESFDCYHAESGLLVEMEMTQPSPMGEISSVTRMRDYQEFGDGRIATRTSIRVMGQQQLLIIEEVEFGPPDAQLFEPPPAIDTLIQDR